MPRWVIVETDRSIDDLGADLRCSMSKRLRIAHTASIGEHRVETHSGGHPPQHIEVRFRTEARRLPRLRGAIEHEDALRRR